MKNTKTFIDPVIYHCYPGKMKFHYTQISKNFNIAKKLAILIGCKEEEVYGNEYFVFYGEYKALYDKLLIAREFGKDYWG